MNVLKKLTLQNLRFNKKRTIVTIIGIILSGAMICGVATIAASFQDLLIQNTIVTDGNYHASFYNVAYGDSKYITNNVSTIHSILSKGLGYSSFQQSNNENKPYIYLYAYSETAFNNLPINLKEGRLPEKKGEILITEDIASSGGPAYKIGETISLAIGNRKGNGRFLYQDTPLTEAEEIDVIFNEEFIVTGIIYRPRNEYYSTPGFTAVSYLDEDLLDNEDIVNVSILVKNPKKIFEIVPKMAADAGDVSFSYNNELLKWMGITQNKAFNNMFNTISLIIITLVVIGSVAVIYNAFAISVSERKKQFGMLSSVGATSNQIRKMIFYEGAILGLIGIPIGIISGIIGIGITLKIVNKLLINSMFNHDIVLRLIVSPYVILTTVLFMTITIFMSVYIPAKRASKISPVEAIRLNTDIKIKGKKLRTSKLTRYLFGIEGELALKNLKRNRRRYRATVFSLFISIVLFVSFSSFMKYGFITSNMYYGGIHYDVMVTKNENTIEEKMEFYQNIAELNDVERYSILRRIHTSTKTPYSQLSSFVQKHIVDNESYSMNEDGSYNHEIYIVAVGEEEFQRFAAENQLDISVFKDTKEPKGILINKNIIAGRIEYNPMNIKTGVNLYLKDNYEDGINPPANIAINIGAVTDNIPLGVPYTFYMAANLLVSDEVFDSIKALLHEESKVMADNTNMLIQTNNSEDIIKEIKALNPNDTESSLSIRDITLMKAEMKRIMTSIAIFLYGFVSLITLIGVTNIFNTISTNVALRRREFAMLKSVGLTPRGFNKMINYESIFYGLKSLLYGLPVGALISMWMYNAFDNIFDFRFVLPWREMIICIFGVFIIVFMTMMHSSAKLKKENIIDALREENL
ncbi:ABC transporter permease [Alkaliphilus peptidifermentans]|uniref:Putative ABC transport system permease protein n=1 Tax=Alkaliphilus peptidifermentans DSM 18978 TaxID=1120976 RepID=A0A1G5CD93_9FIRM|nr:ABC transporter permease [Alkaliphilus peptidifermentans]SCY00316.1 putative ABC transport system permease protein [Alkaliphilus peptidifermentans DSM 18978]